MNPSRVIISVLALLAAVLVPACRSSVEPWEEDLPRASATASDAASTEPEARWVEAEPRSETAAWPAGRGLVLALTRWGSADLMAFDPATGSKVSLAEKIPGETVVSQRGSSLALLIATGVNPAKNVLEIWDLRRAERFRLESSKGWAFFGFTLAPDGTAVAYSEIRLRRSNSRRVVWRVGVADGSRRQIRRLIASDDESVPGGTVPAPFGWSAATGEIYFQGWMPFRGMATSGIWAMGADGSAMRQMLPESAYTSAPRLSSDGRHLAVLATRMEDLPRDYFRSPGAPPANALVRMDLARGERFLLEGGENAALGAFTWAAANEILASRREWREGRFRDVGFVKASVSSPFASDGAAPSAEVTQMAECPSGSLFWVEESREEAVLRSRDARNDRRVTLPEGRIRIAGCWSP